MEALDECIELLFNTLLDAPFCHKPGSLSVTLILNEKMISNILDVFLLVLIRDLDISATRLQVHSVLLTEYLIFHREMFEYHVLNVVVTANS